MNYEDLPKHFPDIYRETASNVSGYYHPDQYKALFEDLDMRKGVPKFSTLPKNTALPISIKIPDVLHYIWLGSALREAYFENIAHFTQEMKKAGGITLLWTDQSTVSGKLKEWLKENDILTIPVSAVFSNTAMPTYYPFKTALAAIPPNYGEASDLLRYEILDLFGGYYLDCDVKKTYLDFAALRFLGATPVFSFVCGYSSYPRNDIVGSWPKSPLCTNLKRIVLSNYKQKIWNEESHMRDRSLMNYATVRTTGPNAFGEAVTQTIREAQLNKKISVNTPYSVQVNSNHSDESWIIYRVTEQNKNREDSIIHIKHDLCLSTFYDAQVLDLQKYNPPKTITLTTIVQELLKDHSALFQYIDRIFIGDVHQYREIQTAFESYFSKPILWNESASLKFASLMGQEALVQYLVREKSINPFAKNSYINMGHYECHFASPLLLAIERGYPHIVKFLLKTAKTSLDIHKCLTTKASQLIYAGEKDFGLDQDGFWFPAEHIYRLKREKVIHPEKIAEIDLKIEQYEMVSTLIEPFRKTPH